MIHERVIPPIYELAKEHFELSSIVINERSEEFHNDADDWVDCWVGCAAVVAQNGIGVRLGPSGVSFAY